MLAAALAAALLALSGLLAACGGGGSGDKLSLVAYSTPQEAYEALIPAFQRTAEGKDVDFTQSYGASGDQERAVEAGLGAHGVAPSLAAALDKLVKGGEGGSAPGQEKKRGLRPRPGG